MTLTIYILCDKTPGLQTETCYKAWGALQIMSNHTQKLRAPTGKRNKAETVNIVLNKKKLRNFGRMGGLIDG